MAKKKTKSKYPKVVCSRLEDATYDKLTTLKSDKFPDMTIAELVRECIINGIARLEVEKNDKSKT